MRKSWKLRAKRGMQMISSTLLYIILALFGISLIALIVYNIIQRFFGT